MNPRRLILASSSPRRRLLLEKAGVMVVVYPVDTDETPKPDESPVAYVERMAEQKMESALNQLREFPLLNEHDTLNKTVLSADTIVTIDGQILTKPASEADAKRIWGLLSGRTHEVITAFTLARGEPKYAQPQTQLVTTSVTFKSITDEQMTQYWASGEPADKSGGYAIQGAAAAWVQSTQGSINNVIGLPVAQVIAALDQLNRLDI